MPTCLKMKSDTLRCTVAVLLMSGVGLRAENTYSNDVSCPVDGCTGLPYEDCCIERTYSWGNNGNAEPDFISTEAVWGRKCEDKGLTPPAGTPTEDSIACSTCNLAPSDPVYTGGYQGDPSTLASSLGQSISLGSDIVPSLDGTYSQEPVGSLGVSLASGPATIPDPVDPMAPLSPTPSKSAMCARS